MRKTTLIGKKESFIIILCLWILGISSLAGAVTTGFVNDPASNSIDWTNNVLSLGGTINSNVNFDTHPLGILQSNFYLLSNGVSLAANGDVNHVLSGAGPTDGNNYSTPLSSGENLHPASNYLYDGVNFSDLTISFNKPVLGAGLFIIDYFNPYGDNPLIITAYDGPNGSGNFLGVFSSVASNFQNNNMYFMGLTSTNADIQSLIFCDLTSNGMDSIGIDNIVFALSEQHAVPDPANSIPEPATLLLLGSGLVGLGAFRRKFKK